MEDGRAMLLSEGSRGEPVSLPFPGNGRLPTFLAHGSLPPSLKSTALCCSLTFYHSDPLFCNQIFLCFPLPLSRMLVIITHDHVSIWGSLLTAKSLRPYNVICSWVLGIRRWTSLEHHYSDYHSPGIVCFYSLIKH